MHLLIGDPALPSVPKQTDIIRFVLTTPRRNLSLVDRFERNVEALGPDYITLVYKLMQQACRVQMVSSGQEGISEDEMCERLTEAYRLIQNPPSHHPLATDLTVLQLLEDGVLEFGEEGRIRILSRSNHVTEY